MKLRSTPCSGYINKYTHHDQCVYSFTVPKTDMNDCKGLEDNVKSLNDRVGYLEKNLDEMRALVNVLNQNVEGEFDCIENKYRNDALNFEVNSNPLRVVKKNKFSKINSLLAF